jgi:photosystem II stability/assembly factor-like uncharacterized protein
MNAKRRRRGVFLALESVLLLLLLQRGTPSSATEPRDSRGRGSEGREAAEGLFDSADDAENFRRLRLRDANGRIPVDGWKRAREHMARMKAAQRERANALTKSGQSVFKPETAGIMRDSWTWLGPGNIGGRIRSIVVSPTNPANIWVGSVGGGIWRTTDGGDSWFPVNDFMPNLAISTMAIDPADPNVMYAGTGEVFPGSSSPPGTPLGPGFPGAGVFKSTDGGVTWNQLASTAGGNWFFVNRLAVSPDGSTLLAATGTGIWRSTDGGETWDQRDSSGVAADIKFDPNLGNRAIAGYFGKMLYSLDGGLNFAPSLNINPAIGTNSNCVPGTALGASLRVELAFAPSNSSLYASIDQNQGDVYRSQDLQTFTRVSTCNKINGVLTTLLGGQGGYANAIWVNPIKSEFVIIGGTNLYRSTDGGSSFAQISGPGPPNDAHSDHHVIVADPRFDNVANRTAFFGNDGGIWKADDVLTVAQNSGWTSLNHRLGITEFYGAAGDAATGVIIGGTQDNGTLKFSGGTVPGGPNTESWKDIGFGGDGGTCAIDPTNSNYLYGETLFPTLKIRRSTDGGNTNSIISGGISDIGSTYFTAPLILDPNDPARNTMLVGALSLWRSTNVKAPMPTWAAIKSPTNFGISALAVANGNPNFVVVGHGDGEIYLTTNGTANTPTWTKISPPRFQRFLTRLIIDESTSPYWIYATFGGFSSGNVVRTTDSGATWADISGSGLTALPQVAVYSMAIHPVFPNLLYVGTEVGVFASEDAGATWEVPQDGPANVAVADLFWMGGDLVAATHGRGVFRASGGVYVDRANTAFIQTGTIDHPFGTVAAGVDAVSNYTAVWIHPGNYNEPMTINKRLELRSTGGTVTIGAP